MAGAAGDLLQERLRQRAAAKAARGPARASAPAPLSFGQERIWFQEQLTPNTTAFNRAAAVRLTGALDRRALEQSLADITVRHAILRTAFRQTEQDLVQEVMPQERFVLPFVDMSGLVAAEQAAALAAALSAAVSRPFDIEHGPLLRAALWRLGRREHILLIETHHIAADGWSDGVFWRELDALYGARARGEEADLPPLPLQFADVARAERDPARAAALEESVSYWRRRLAGLERPELPADGPRRTGMASSAILNVAVTPALTARLRELSRSADVTLFMTLLAAFQVLLGRYTNSDDVAVGSAVSGRAEADLEWLIGMFVNTLVLRADLSGDPTFFELLRQTRQVALEAYRHQHVPFELLVKELQPERDFNRNPLFDVFFQLTSFARTGDRLGDLVVEPLPAMSTEIELDLNLTFRDEGERLLGEIVYNRDRFDAARMERLFDNYLVLLQAAVDDPHTAVSALPLLDNTQRQRILAGWNRTAVTWPEEGPLPRLFEQQVARTPLAIAVIDAAGAAISFDQLNRRANRLARYLRSLGLDSGVTAALALPRSIDFLVALLAVMKSGAAYLPLDPTYPLQRLAHMATVAQPSLLLTTGAMGPAAKELGIPQINLETIKPQLAALQDTNLQEEPDASDAAYVIFTSGSTGRPKGVRIPHRAVSNFALALQDALAMSPDDRVWQFADISFDTAIEEIFPALIAGAAVVLRPADIPPVSRLAELVSRYGLTVLDPPTAYWQEWIAYLEESGEALPPLRLVITGGEKIEASWWRRWQALPGSDGIRLLNGYGATELTAITTLFDSAEADAREAVPIGRPIANVQAYILSKGMLPQPPGVPGELYVGGAGLADGYLGDSALTRERFIANPFCAELPATSSRIFRTGDLAAYDENGRITYLGRADQQIKLRGFRIEPAEIESLLSALTGVSQAVVTLVTAREGEKALAAYVVPAAGAAPPPESLRAHLAARLPAYMIPSYFVTLSELPLNAHGKVNRQSLPVPAAVLENTAAQRTRPLTESEQAISAIWRELLGFEEIGPDDDFFALGGHSLLGLRLFTLIESRLGYRLPLSLLFQMPTIAAMAAALTPGRADEAAAPPVLVTLRPGENGLPIFAPHGIYGDNLAFREVAKHLPEGRPFYAFQAVGLLPEHAADQSIEAMAARYVEVMRQVQARGPYHLVSNCFGGHIAYEMACQLEEMGEPVALLALVDTTAAAEFHDPAPLLDRKRLEALRAAMPHFLAGYPEFGGLRLEERLRGVLTASGGTRQKTRHTREIYYERPDVIADVRVERPPIQHALRAHHALLHGRYRHRPFGGNMVLIRPRALHIGELLRSSYDPLRGWGNLTAGVDVHYVGGSHSSMLGGDNAAEIARLLSALLEGEE